jgi:hypothetical protein
MDPQMIPNPSLNLAPALQQIINGVLAFYPILVVWIKDFAGFLVGLSWPLSLFFFIGIIYCVEQLKYIRKKEDEISKVKVVPAFEDVPASENVMTKRWESVKAHIATDNPNDWRQAIIDADIILDDILNRMGYHGESVGEKLKRVAKGDFATLDDAWEAHKVRNQIAHEGSALGLNHHEAKAAIDRYKRVFEEFYYI